MGYDRDALDKKSKEQGGKFIKLEDGEDITGIFLGEPRGFDTVFNPKTGRTEDFDAGNPKHQALEVQTKAEWNFYDVEAQAVRIFTLSLATYRKVRALQDKQGDDALLEIYRDGTDKKTRYIPKARGRMNRDEYEDLVKNAKLFDLAKRDGEGSSDDDEEVPRRRRRDEKTSDPEASESRQAEERRRAEPSERREDKSAQKPEQKPASTSEWDRDDLRELKTAANQLSDPDYERLLGHFKVSRVDQIDPVDARDAHRLIQSLSRSNGVTHDDTSVDDDPFTSNNACR